MTPRKILITLGILAAILLAMYALGFLRIAEELAPGEQPPPVSGTSQPPLSGGDSGR